MDGNTSSRLPLRTGPLAFAAAGALITAALLPGCVGYSSYPPTEGNFIEGANPNSPPMDEVMTTGLAWLVEKYPPTGARRDLAAPAPEPGEGPALAISLPIGVKPPVYRRVAQKVGNGAVPVTEETSHLPTYFVAAIRVRGDTARVDAFRPATELGAAPGGGTVYQEFSINLTGGLSRWRVVNAREWTPGTVAPPPPNFYAPEPEPGHAPAAQAAEPAPPPAAPEHQPSEADTITPPPEGQVSGAESPSGGN